MSRDSGNKRKTVAIDLDGTLVEYNGWVKWSNLGELMKDARVALQCFHDNGWTVIIHTTRADVNMVWEWVKNQGLLYCIQYVNVNPANIDLGLNMGKPIARIYIDDRAYPYCGERPIVWKEIMDDLVNRGILDIPIKLS